jgi:hypothetical protein
MIEEDRLYTFACTHLYTVCSAYYQLEEISVDNVPTHGPEWWALVEGSITRWLLNEAYGTSWFSTYGHDDEQYYAVVDKMDSVADDGVSKIRLEVDRLLSTYKLPNRRGLVYLAYCAWLLSITEQFERIVLTIGSNMPQVLDAYRQASPMFKKLQESLVEELSLPIDIEGGERMYRQTVRREIKDLSKELAALWRHAVFTAADVRENH